MYVRYTFSNLGKNSTKTRDEAIKSTDEAAKAVGDLIKIIGTASNAPRMITWVLARAYTRKITKEYVEYHFWLIDWLTKLSKKGVDTN
jgi:hypothetical protein